MGKIEEARDFLQMIGMPKAQQTDICCYVRCCNKDSFLIATPSSFVLRSKTSFFHGFYILTDLSRCFLSVGCT